MNQHSTPDHGGGPRTSTARPTKEGGPAPAQHARPGQRAQNRHSTPDQSGRPSNNTARLTVEVGHAPAPHARP